MKRIFNKIVIKSIGFYINSLSYVFPEKAVNLAYKFFSEPREGRLLLTTLPAILKEAKNEFITFENDKFPIYIWEGNQNIILLVHGWESNASRWEKMLPFLSKSGSTIIAIDAPAHGLSSGKEFNVPRYSSFLNIVVQKFHPQTLIGHSLGGSACLYYQHHYTNTSISKMVLLGAPSDLKILIQNYVNLLSLNSKVVQLIENYFIDRFHLKIENFSGKIFGSSLKIKGIIAHDHDDLVVSFEEGKKIAESWKNATFIETKGLGHSMHNDELYQKITHYLFEEESVIS